jgi:hypothetical protein
LADGADEGQRRAFVVQSADVGQFLAATVRDDGFGRGRCNTKTKQAITLNSRCATPEPLTASRATKGH